MKYLNHHIMRKLFFFLVILLISNSIIGQHCLPNGIRFQSQSDIDQYSANYPGCSIIDGDVVISGGDITDLSGLAQVRKVKGKFVLYNNPELASLSGLDSLMKAGEMRIRYNPQLTSLSGLGLLDSVGTLHIQNNSRLLHLTGLDALTTVEYLTVLNNHKLKDLKGMPVINTHLYGVKIVGNTGLSNLMGLERLSSVDNLTIGQNEHLTSLHGLENLHFTQNSLYLYENGITSLSGLDQYTGTEGYIKIVKNNYLVSSIGTPRLITTDALIITDNLALRDLSGFRNITTLRNLDIARNNHLGTLVGLQGLASVSNNVNITENKNLVDLRGLEGISTIGGNLSIRLNDQLTSLSGLGGLSHLGGTLRIYANNRLGNILDLSALKTVEGRVQVEFNTTLTSLSGLDNIDAALVEHLSIVGNIQLSICHVRSICEYLALGKPAQIEGNASGCLNTPEVNQKCSETQISGTVFFDVNRDKTRSAGEHGIPNVEITIEPGNVTLLTGTDGSFTYYGAVAGTRYTVRITPPAGMLLTTDSAAYHLLFDVGNPGNSHRDFGLYHKNPTHQLDISTAGAISRCGFVVPFHTTVTNTGSFQESVCFDVRWDDEMQWAGSSPTPTSIDSAGHTARFCRDSLNPFERFEVLYWLHMPGVQSRGDTLEVTAEAFAKDTSGYVSQGSDTLKSPLLCAYDPNDKSVNPYGVREEHFTLMNRPLRYLIHFQNVGDIAAENVRIEDGLDPALDLHTLRVLQASHPYRVEMDEQHGVIFYFDNIHLADSTSDVRASQGYILYEISPNANTPDHTIVYNKAAIFFDYNPAIETGTTMNTLVHQIPVITRATDKTKSNIHIYPLPAQDVLVIELRNGKALSAHYQITAVDGKTANNGILNSEKHLINTSQWPNGLYALRITARTGEVYMNTIMIQH